MAGAWIKSLAVYADRRVLSILFLGFSSGLPILLTGATLSAWLREVGVTRTAIGFITLVGLAYGLKFVWSPLVDRMPIPILTRCLGRRRSWLLVSQIALVGTILGLGTSDPSTMEGLRATVWWAVAVAFASATQDIAVDAYRTEILERAKLGAGAANVQFGYRFGMLAAGGGALIVADLAGWFWAYATMALLMAVGIVATLINPEPAVYPDPKSMPATATGEAVAGTRRWVAWLRGAVIGPYADLTARPGWIVILLFVGFYKYGDSLLGVMANPFYIDLGFSKTEIALVSKGYGLGMTLVGTAVGGIFVLRLGILKSLLIGGVLQAASNLVFAAQAVVGYSVAMLSLTIGFENLSGGLASAAFVAYLSSLCNVAYTATQYALLSSLAAFTGKVLASGSGWLADQVGWYWFFVLTTVAAVPGMALLIWMIRRYPVVEGAETSTKSRGP